METDTTLASSDEYINQPIETLSREFNNQLHLQSDEPSPNSKLLPEAHQNITETEDDDNDNDDDDDDDFTFMFVGGDADSTIDGEKVLENGETRPVFPLFDQNLLLDGDYELEEVDRLPIQPPVDKIFIPLSENDESQDGTTGPYCVWSKESVTLSKKSNSTGFSKLWRLKDKGGRSNSYGRDAFVFFKNSDKKSTTTAITGSSSSAPATGDDQTFKVNVAGGKAKLVKQGTKGKKSTVSAHEAYLKSREEDRRRSYLPYRPELMGFFTNVHGGLTKNVHPY
ncbi:hypothetical protein Hdeb2414_s0033g00718291 [Helianthus debilis subsp. tardiflorus]